VNIPLAARVWERAKGIVLLVAVMVTAAALRLISLNYSEFQGDEVKALYPAEAGLPLWLLGQTKGPIQFLVTLTVRLVSGGYGEWQTRLPFALASLLTVLVVYLLVREAFDRRRALWAAALTASCGLLVAFGRIVQYQAFVMLAVASAAWFLVRWIRRDRMLYLYAGFLSFAFGILAHYDALTFGPAFAALLVLGFLRREQRTRRRLLHLGLAALSAGLLLSLFYVPFVLRPGFGLVAQYLGGRVAAGLGSTTFAQVGRLLGLYLPPGYLAVVGALALIGAVVALARTARPFGPIIVLWFVVPFVFYMLLGGRPRSHVYMVVLPGLILAALAIEAVLSRVHPDGWGVAARAAVWAALALSAGMAYFMLVDHGVEHPWEAKTVLGYRLPNLVSGNVQGVFGFPYRRGLAQVGDRFRAGQLRGTFDSNERDAAAEFYFGAPRSSPPAIYFDEQGSTAPDYYIYVLRPFSLRRDLPAVVRETYRQVDKIRENGRTTIEIYAAPWVLTAAAPAP